MKQISRIGYRLAVIIAVCQVVFPLIQPHSITQAQEPDGGLIAFQSLRDGNWEVYVMNADGSSQINLTNYAGEDFEPTWSPDGAQIAFISNRPGVRAIYVMNADGSNVSRITNTSSQDREPAWSPDGTRIVFKRDSMIFVINIDGTNEQQLTFAGISENPAWSPDSELIAFAHRTHPTDDFEIYAMNADGSNQHPLTNNGNPSEGQWDDDIQPAWSPDGTQIAFVSNRDDDIEIYMMNADGSNQTRLTNHGGNDTSPAWSPDGSKLAFDASQVAGWDVYVMNADGTEVTRLTTDPEYDSLPAWQPIPPVGCYSDAPSDVFQGDTFTLTLRCDDIGANLFGFQAGHEIAAGASLVTAQVANYTAGTVFQGQPTLAGPNTLPLYALSLQAGSTQATGDFTLGSVDYSADFPGAVTFDLINLILGDISGTAIPNVTAPVTSTTVTITDLILSLAGTVDPEGFVSAENLELVLESSLGYTDLQKTLNPDGTIDFVFTNIKGQPDWLQADGPSHVTCEETLTFPPDAGDEVLPNPLILRAGDVNSDDMVDITDAAAIGLGYGQAPTGELDINHDDAVNILDLIHVGRNYGTTGPTNCTP